MQRRSSSINNNITAIYNTLLNNKLSQAHTKQKIPAF